jgi:heme a synthase
MMNTVSMPTPLPHSPSPAAGDATLNARRSHLAIWLWSGAALTFLILVIGGITRLTQSGLSMVDWRPIIGIIPPIGEAQWLAEFERYRQFPEYQQLRAGMTLDEFKFIFFWEYIHRVAARLIGIVFLAPFLLFWVRGYFGTATMPVRRALILFALGGLQGFMGWFMVSSGLVDRPHVSHYRLGVHLAIAFAIFGFCVWFALDLRRPTRGAIANTARRMLLRGLAVVGVLLALQIFWGALVAGLRAGLYYPTFPLMDGSLIPPFAWGYDPLLRNLVENPITVQWVHRVLGTLLGLAVVLFFLRVRGSQGVDRHSRILNTSLLALIAAQYLLGVLTLVLHIPVSLGVAHQAMAMVVFGIWLVWLHHVQRMTAAPG